MLLLDVFAPIARIPLRLAAYPTLVWLLPSMCESVRAQTCCMLEARTTYATLVSPIIGVRGLVIASLVVGAETFRTEVWCVCEGAGVGEEM